MSNFSLDARYGYVLTLSSFLFFQLVNKLVIYVGPPKTLQGSEHEFWKYKNVLISWIHACIVGPWTLGCIFFIPEYWTDSIVYVEPYGYGVLAFSLGYFFYDCFDVIVNKKLLKMWEVCLHHLAVISTFTYNMATMKFVGYSVFALLVEINSIFLHARKLMQMAKVDFKHPFYRLNNVINIVSFSFCRFGALIFITYGLALPQEHDRIATHGSLAYLVTLALAMVTMWVINPILYWRLLKNDFLRKMPRKCKTNGVESNGLNNNVGKVH